MRGMTQAVDDLNAFLDALMVDEDVLPEQVVLFGFSQGTMMALHVAPRREDAVAASSPSPAVCSAPRRSPMRWWYARRCCWCTAMPMTWCRRNRCLRRRKRCRRRGGRMSIAHIMKGTGHGIAPDGLSVALAFMRDKLSL